jgi:putative cardiolipin synthase
MARPIDPDGPSRAGSLAPSVDERTEAARNTVVIVPASSAARSFIVNRAPAIPATVLELAFACAAGDAIGLARSALRGLVAVLMTATLAACASLPGGVQRPYSAARDDVSTTALAAIDAASTPADARELSGFRLLPAGDQAFDARIALARRAETTLDVQYYQIAADGAGLQFLRALRDAAARGVRVRVLVDDLYAAGEDALLAGLAEHPNVEVRLFNPLPMRSGGFGTRVVFSLHQFSRINRRMHNKLFIADNTYAVTGGRNIADAYFGRSEPANFIDMDVLASGPVVRELSAVFDGYWNDEHAYPVQGLAGARFDAEAARAAFDAKVADLAEPAAGTARDSLGQTALEAQLAAGRVEQHRARARVLADRPGKVETATNSAGSTTPDAEDGTVAGATLDLIGSARSEVIVASPYFVPGERGLETIRAAVERDVQVLVMTNSLSTTDEPLVHYGYSRHRGELLKMGVALYELMPTDTNRHAESTLESHGSLGRLHAKLAVVDARWLFIGSMNMDRRSARWNTEMGLVIDSPELADEVRTLLQRERLPGSYRLRIAAGDPQRIEWIASPGNADVVYAKEPALTPGRRLRLRITSSFVSEEML